MNSETNEEYKRIFRLFDTDNNGHITVEEFHSLLNKLGIKRTIHEVTEMVKFVDIDGNGQIEYEEFCEIINSQKTTKHEDDDAISDAFSLIDTDKKGFIVLSDVVNYIRRANIKVPYSVIIEEFEHEDTEHTEHITINRFRDMVFRTNNITNFKIIADLLVLIDKVEIKNSLNSLYGLSETIHNYYDLLKNYYIFKKMYRARLYKICKHITDKTYQYREPLCYAKTPITYVFIIVSGTVSVENKIKSTNTTFKNIGDNFIIGINELIKKRKVYPYSFISRTTTRVFKIPVDIIKELLITDPVFLFRIKEFIKEDNITITQESIPTVSKPKKIKQTHSYSRYGRSLDKESLPHIIKTRRKYLVKS